VIFQKGSFEGIHHTEEFESPALEFLAAHNLRTLYFEVL
jgi:hypothetical protein